jgi:hypothetical protein
MSTNAVGSDWLSVQLEKCRPSPSATLLSREEDANKTNNNLLRYTRPKKRVVLVVVIVVYDEGKATFS